MDDREALTLRRMDVVFNKDVKTLNRVERVTTDTATGRVSVALFGKMYNHDAKPCALCLVYRAGEIPPGVLVRLGPVRFDRMPAIQQAIDARRQEQEAQDRERNGEIDHGTH